MAFRFLFDLSLMLLDQLTLALFPARLVVGSSLVSIENGSFGRIGRSIGLLRLIALPPKHEFLQPVHSIGAPRFELGTSSPPDSSSAQVPSVAEWWEVPDVQGLSTPSHSEARFPPRPRFESFGPLVGPSA